MQQGAAAAAAAQVQPSGGSHGWSGADLCSHAPPLHLPALAPSLHTAAGALAALLLGLNVARTYQDKLRQFLADVAGDQVSMAGAPEKGD